MTGDRRPRVGVLHAPNAAVGVRDIVVAARELVDLVLMVRQSVALANPGLVDLGRALAEVAVVADEQVPAEAADLGLAGLTTFHDGELEFCDAALAALALPGAPGITGPWDKLVQRQRFAAAEVSAVRAMPVDSPDELAAAVREVGLPAVLKPRRSTGSVGLSFLLDEAAVPAQLPARTEWRHLVLEQLILPSTHPAGVPYLADYVSVETVSHHGEHTHFAVFDKIPLSTSDGSSPLRYTVRETGDVLPSQLPADIRAAALTCTSRVLDALAVRCRVSHTELRVTPSGVDVIEVNGRLGGEVARMVRLLGGSDPVRAALELALGRRPAFTAPAGAGYLSCLYVPFPQRTGTVRSDVTRARIRQLPGVVSVDEVARLGDLRSDTGFHAAKVLLCAADAGELEGLLATAVEQIAALYADDGLADDGWLHPFRDRPPVRGARRTVA